LKIFPGTNTSFLYISLDGGKKPDFCSSTQAFILACENFPIGTRIIFPGAFFNFNILSNFKEFFYPSRVCLPLFHSVDIKWNSPLRTNKKTNSEDYYNFDKNSLIVDEGILEGFCR